MLEPEDYSREWEAARAFDAQLTRNNLYGDVFGEGEVDLEDTEYWKVLLFPSFSASYHKGIRGE